MLKVLLIGGTGTVGREVVRRLNGRGVVPRVMTRRAGALTGGADPGVGVAGSPVGPGQHAIQAEYVPGDLADPASLTVPFRDIERVFLLTPLVPDEEALGLAAVEAARAAGVERLVFQHIHRAEACPAAPHFQSKIRIAKAVRDSGIPFTLVSPSNFFQNDLMFREALLGDGLYPQPIGTVGVSAVDVRDIAEAVVTSLLEPGHEGREYPLVGPDALTGPGIAAIWSSQLGRPIRYAGDDLGHFAREAGRSMPGWLVEDLVIMYRCFQEQGLRASETELSVVRGLLGRRPRDFDSFAAETARGWGIMAGA